jgi:hypothetical protein
MSTLTKARRMPAQYRVRAGGITEIVYNATPEIIVVLPGTRWLEQRREREARLAAETAQLLEETQLAQEKNAPPAAPMMIDTELADFDFSADSEISSESDCQPDELTEFETLSWTDRMRVATTKLIKRQSPWFSSLRGSSPLQLSTQD